MKLSLLLITVLLSTASSKKEEKNVLQLAYMVTQIIDCQFPYFPIPYGCWCGFTPNPPEDLPTVDGFDESCKEHDFCYDDAVANGCDWLDEYVWNYDWDLSDDGKEVICAEDQDFCQKAMCECDKGVAYALRDTSKELGCPDGNPGCPYP
eukprot:TRINITY_DN11674_c0_g1_i1.p1 TRINITY_DN11674_c0_g1~~TRINITY_DN11674_c0_g1_i1.p1  ORF type:complete len:150 (-),score=8.71 TRINITY_DN11674_c0_g1_i1:29-478(-)